MIQDGFKKLLQDILKIMFHYIDKSIRNILQNIVSLGSTEDIKS